MRFLFYDVVTDIEKGKSIRGIKTFALSEEIFRRHFRREAVIPGVIMIEAMAQILGWLIIYSHDFTVSPVMSLIEDVKVTPRLRPGIAVEIAGEIISTSPGDSLGRVRMTAGGKEIASIGRIIYSHVRKAAPDELRKRFRYYGGVS